MLPALEHLKMAVKCCEQSSTYILDLIFIILSCNKDSHEISEEFEILGDSSGSL